MSQPPAPGPFDDPERRQSSAGSGNLPDDDVALETRSRGDSEENVAPVQEITQDNIADLNYADIVARIALAEGTEKLQLELAQAKMELWQLENHKQYLDNEIGLRGSITEEEQRVQDGLRYRKTDTNWKYNEVETKRKTLLKSLVQQRITELQQQSESLPINSPRRQAIQERINSLNAESSYVDSNGDLSAANKDEVTIWKLPDTTEDIFGFDKTRTINADNVIRLTPEQIDQRLHELQHFNDPAQAANSKVLTPIEEHEKLQLDLWLAEIAKRNLAANASDSDKQAANDKVEAAKAAVIKSEQTAWDFSKYVPPKVASTEPGGTTQANQPLEFEDNSSNPWELHSKYVLGQMFEALMKFLTSLGFQYVFDYTVARPTSGAYSALAGFGLFAVGAPVKLWVTLITALSGGKYQFPIGNKWADGCIAKSEKYTGTWALFYDPILMGLGIKKRNGYALLQHAKNHDLVKAVQVATFGLFGLSDGIKFTKKNLYSYCARTANPADPSKSWFAPKRNIVLWTEQAKEHATGAKNNPSFGSIPTKQQFAWWSAFVIGAPIVAAMAPVFVAGALTLGPPFLIYKALKNRSAKAAGASSKDDAEIGPRNRSASTLSETADAQMRMRSASVSSAPDAGPGPGPTLRAPMANQDQSQHTMRIRSETTEEEIKNTNSISAALIALSQKIRDAFPANSETLVQRFTTPFRAVASFLSSFNFFRATGDQSFRDEQAAIAEQRRLEQERRKRENTLGGTDSNASNQPEAAEATRRKKDSNDNSRHGGPAGPT